MPLHWDRLFDRVTTWPPEHAHSEPLRVKLQNKIYGLINGYFHKHQSNTLKPQFWNIFAVD